MRLGLLVSLLLALVAGTGCREVPCAGKSCGDRCEPWAGAFIGTSDEIKACDVDGECRSAYQATATCHAPCAGKTCGEACSLCPPDARDCALADSSADAMCDENEQCVPTWEVCPEGEECSRSPKCP